jgi:phosphoribosyl-ATP pyrophosphohydrolase/phosphoribosyl-AMP cyclohydrolase
MIDFAKGEGLVPAIIQDARDQQVLMLAYINEESWQKTLATKRLCFYSRSKKRLWTKGEESGNYLHLVSYQVDCDRDTLLVQVEPQGPTCHQGSETCFGEKSKKGFAPQLEEIISQRLLAKDEGSYVNNLSQKGLAKVAQKVGEEAVELVIEAMGISKDLFLNEAADLLFHYLLLLRVKGFKLSEVEELLWERHQAKA